MAIQNSDTALLFCYSTTTNSETLMLRYKIDSVREEQYCCAGGSSTKSFRPEAKKEGGWVKTILEKKSIY